ncbi:TonB-dependent receptor [Noviherbaspirillum sp. CPCC 100848]|uniref:TonB-dependent receptor n=1 Tax=Noviherbaspirillum album TaxID=3080276 RepID=A0ABU6JEV8_9BURK|nr:TonB-dependent receptor [Noviherbaspirillum sp. CPCC 100848]MEC4722068.1 TonB-dependent receptor [Noviherbaspirillum sp. CPCC 100848]
MRFLMSRRAALSGIAALGSCVLIPASAQTTAPTQNAVTDTEASLPAVEVVGRRQSGSYHADEASGTKTDLPLRELPQSVRIMSRQTLDDLGATRIDDALDYVGGISRQNNFGGLWDNVAIRGLAGDINNGMPLLLNGFSGNRGFNAPRDTANVERIEFLKGPAASLYGTSEPGGTINVVTKKPLWKAAHSIEAYAGSDDFYRTALDTTGPLGERVAYRLNVAVEKRGSFRDHVDTQRAIIAPALTWKLTPSTRLDYSGEVLRHETPLDRGIVAIGNRLGDVPRSRFLGEPADGDIRIDNQTHQLALEHMFNAQWSSRVGLSYKEGSLKGYSTEAQPALQPDERTLRRQRRFRDYASDDVTLQAELIGRLQAGAVAHELLAGMETYRLDFDQRMLRANPTSAAPYAIDVFNPVYGQPQPVPLPNTDTSEEQKNLAFYLQDTMSLGEHWRLLGGVRFDRYDQSLLNNRTGARIEQSPTATSPRIGISYLPNPQWTLFANAGKSFRPNNGSSASASPFDPESGRAAEVGAKWENESKTLGATLALYEIRKKNVLTADPVNAGFSIAAGEVRSRGMDFDLTGQLSRNWRLNASLAYIDASVERDNLLEAGGRLLNIPRINGSVLAMYEDAFSDGTRYGIGGGFTYSAKRLGEARTQAQAAAGAPAFELPSYTVARLAAYWRISPALRLSLDVDNLFDKTYYTSSFQRTWVTVGNPRTVVLGLQAKF